MDRQKAEGNYDGYMLPDSEFNSSGKIDSQKEMAKLTQRYVDSDIKEIGENVDQLAWEQAKLNMANLKFGAEDRRDAPSEYDYVFDDQIEFLQQEILAGELSNTGGAVPQLDPNVGHFFFFKILIFLGN